MLDRLTIVATDLFPDLVREIRAGTVTATIYQRPRTQGSMALRVLYEFLAEGARPPRQSQARAGRGLRSRPKTVALHLRLLGNRATGTAAPKTEASDDIPF